MTDPSPNKKAHHRHVSAFGPGEWSLSASGICKRSLEPNNINQDDNARQPRNSGVWNSYGP